MANLHELVELILNYKNDGKRWSSQAQKQLVELFTGHFGGDEFDIGQMEEFLRKLKHNAIQFTEDLNNEAAIAANRIRTQHHIKLQDKRLDEELLIKEAAEELGMTGRNLNYLITEHNIKVRQQSQRKRYITLRELNRVRNLKGRKKSQ